MARWRRPIIGAALLVSMLAGGLLLTAAPAAACDRCGHYGRHCEFRRSHFRRPRYYGSDFYFGRFSYRYPAWDDCDDGYRFWRPRFRYDCDDDD